MTIHTPSLHHTVRALLAAMLFAGTMMAPAAMALDAAEMFDDPAQEARARHIGRQLRCLVCQNESIFDSNAGLARDLRVLVREQIDAGQNDDAIIDYVVARYGDYVLLEPPMKGGTLALWAAPLLFLSLGGVALLVYHRSRARTRPEALTDAERAEAQRLLTGE
ncbi:cytochrome c-type biogenesis protein [Tropicimonas isoalkanivorans]|uniref:Cytochrome c-type biogenesis protein n=1 Tax=Tropicimonas isoalkanivorans TaxID=441112 RepID=A0A1I1ELG2_9RHOB|nr:cytochrome c-type biogenesis protein [Tropicimonas isoalkanivorans]SFB86318.1 cytochrome c-type biogenesis protein CcmH [Tropicimonas isoalkanivorans]